MTPQRFRKKPVEIEAIQFTRGITPSDAMDIYRWVENDIGSVAPPCDDDGVDSKHVGVTIDPADGLMVIRTLEGDMKVSLDDWIIKGIQGEFYPCKSEIFAATYEAVEG